MRGPSQTISSFIWFYLSFLFFFNSKKTEVYVPQGPAYIDSSRHLNNVYHSSCFEGRFKMNESTRVCKRCAQGKNGLNPTVCALFELLAI